MSRSVSWDTRVSAEILAFIFWPVARGADEAWSARQPSTTLKSVFLMFVTHVHSLVLPRLYVFGTSALPRNEIDGVVDLLFKECGDCIVVSLVDFFQFFAECQVCVYSLTLQKTWRTSYAVGCEKQFLSSVATQEGSGHRYSCTIARVAFCSGLAGSRGVSAETRRHCLCPLTSWWTGACREFTAGSDPNC